MRRLLVELTKNEYENNNYDVHFAKILEEKGENERDMGFL